MLSHSAIWDAIDSLATRHGFTASGLAKLAGLDATAFNRSKRVSRDGRERWPSTESIAKLLEATGESFDAFLSSGGAYLQGGSGATGATVPLLGLAQAGAGGFFDAAGFPAGEGCRSIATATASWCHPPSKCGAATAWWSRRATAR
jgi:phage repressor protein C with HTH and peptisase S24 domain